MINLKFDNKFLSGFEFDRGPSHIPRITLNVLGSLVLPTPVKSPSLVALSHESCNLLGLKNDILDMDLMAQIFSGNTLPEGAEPYSTRYGGHQFGSWADQLGDGRAISIGEVEGVGSWEVQLKGAGLTPYSRRGDGRAVLRSSIREFIASEAMFYLGVPTTRALCCVLTGDSVTRDMFYDGNPNDEMGAITTRLSPTFIRFGHFEILAANSEYDLLKRLVTFTAKNYANFEVNNSDSLIEWFKQICVATCELVIHWQRVGFVHGVLNTDNMSILGLTIDYGPFGFLDNYDTSWTPNTTDAENKRYRYSDQPEIVYWNLQRLAEALSFTQFDTNIGAGENQKALINGFNSGLKAFAEKFEQEFPVMMAKKIGILDFDLQTDMQLLVDLDENLSIKEIDYTIFYRMLSDALESNLDLTTSNQLSEFLSAALYNSEYTKEAKYISRWQDWMTKYLLRLKKSKVDLNQIVTEMNKTNPFIVPRNYILQDVIDDISNGSREKLNDLLRAIQTPYQKNDFTKKYFAKRPDWARTRAGCSALSCSS